MPSGTPLAVGQFGIGHPVEERGADRVALALLQRVEAIVQPARRFVALRHVSWSGVSSAIVGGFLDRRVGRTPRARTQSIARLRAIVASHEIGLARPGSNAPARFQIVR